MAFARCEPSGGHKLRIECVVGCPEFAAGTRYERGRCRSSLERAAATMIELAIEGEAIELFTSRVSINELATTLGYSKFSARLAAFGTSISALVGQYVAMTNVVAANSVPRVVAGDADDDHVIAAAVAARAESIVTGDRRHLLPLRSWQGIAIVTAREVVDRIEALGG